MKNRSRAFHCAIADKAVGISLRHGGGLQEPERVYIRCDERDCQHVDLNQPPCPLKIEMFADGSDRSVADYLAAEAGTRFCYACLTEALRITHEQVRRASWRLKDEPGFTIKPARCGMCHRRRMTVGLPGPEPRSVSAVPAPSTLELKAYLRAHAGYSFCTHCLAREIKTSPGALRDAMWTLEAEPTFQIRTAQCVSCLLTKRVIRHEDSLPGVEEPRRVVEFLLQSPGLAFCASCVAFSTDLGLADVRRILESFAPVAEIESEQGACEGCGRWQTVTRLRGDGDDDAQRLLEVADVVTGHLRHRGFRVDLLSYRSADGWRPFALVRSAAGALVPDAPAIVFGVMPTKIEADELAASHAREWIDKRVP
jgi:hypothetical protein